MFVVVTRAPPPADFEISIAHRENIHGPIGESQEQNVEDKSLSGSSKQSDLEVMTSESARTVASSRQVLSDPRES